MKGPCPTTTIRCGSLAKETFLPAASTTSTRACLSQDRRRGSHGTAQLQRAIRQRERPQKVTASVGAIRECPPNLQGRLRTPRFTHLAVVGGSALTSLLA